MRIQPTQGYFPLLNQKWNRITLNDGTEQFSARDTNRLIDGFAVIFVWALLASAYDPLHARYVTRRVNHQEEYRADDGTTNNLAESYFSRFRRMQLGQNHRFGVTYLANYANEAAYREDMRRQSNGEIYIDIVTKCAKTRTSHDWCGYWQGNKRSQERLAA